MSLKTLKVLGCNNLASFVEKATFENELKPKHDDIEKRVEETIKYMVDSVRCVRVAMSRRCAWT